MQPCDAEAEPLQVNEWSLLYTWRGSNTSLKPVLCISHLDVVPVTAEAAWTQPPFGGIIKDGRALLPNVSSPC